MPCVGALGSWRGESLRNFLLFWPIWLFLLFLPSLLPPLAPPSPPISLPHPSSLISPFPISMFSLTSLSSSQCSAESVHQESEGTANRGPIVRPWPAGRATGPGRARCQACKRGQAGQFVGHQTLFTPLFSCHRAAPCRWDEMDGRVLMAEKSLLVGGPPVRSPCPVSSRSGPGPGPGGVTQGSLTGTVSRGPISHSPLNCKEYLPSQQLP